MYVLWTISASVIADSDIAALCKTAKTWTFLPNRQHCQKFYLCTGADEEPFQEYSCPTGHYFSEKLKICVRGACSDESIECEIENSVARKRDDCSKYLTCMEGGAHAVSSCPSGTYFDPGRRACLPVAVNSAHQCSCVLPENATLSNPNDCETYFRCHDGEAVLVQCPPGEYFAVSANTCLPDLTGICLEKPTLPPGLSEHAQALDECTRTGSRLAPHSRNCQRYFICARKRVLEMRCPRGQYFDVVHKYCNLDSRSECQEVEAEKEIVANSKAQKEIQKVKQKPRPKETQKQVDKKEPQGDGPEMEVSAKQPEQETVSSYDKFSSKFITFIRG